MVLTAVSSAWPQNGRHASQPSWRNAHRTRHALSCRVEPKRYRSGSVRQRPTGRRLLSLQPEKRETTCGLWQSRPSSKPLAASAIAPDPCRGWGRHPSAHIRAQREPVVPPAGTGTEYRRPEGFPDGSPRRGRPGVRRLLAIDGSISINGVAEDAIRGEAAFSSREPVVGQPDVHTVAEGDVCWGIPHSAGGWPRR